MDSHKKNKNKIRISHDAEARLFNNIQPIPCKCGTLLLVDRCKKMKPLPLEFREKIVKAYEQGDTSIRKVAARFDVSKAFVQKLLKQKQTIGHVQPKK
jgi:hypothetical protein